MTKASSQGAEGGSLSFLQELQILEGELFRNSYAKYKYKDFRKGNYKRTILEVNYLCHLVINIPHNILIYSMYKCMYLQAGAPPFLPTQNAASLQVM